MSAPAFPLALPRPTASVFVLDERELRRGITASRESPRRRIILPINRSDTEAVQRLVNFLQAGSYIRAHRHPKPENVENATVLQGSVLALIFDEAGNVAASHQLVAGKVASCTIDIEQGVWHTFLALEDDTVVLEIKRGPYDAKTDKEFAPWSPEEGSDEAAAWVREMMA